MRYILLSSLVVLFASCSRTILSQPLSDLKELSADKYQGRKAGTQANRNAADYIIKRMEDAGLKPLAGGSWKQDFKIKNSKSELAGQNILGYIEGKRSKKIVLSAHYDHLGVIGGKIYNGADDNASGVAGLLALAKYFQKNKPEFTLIFAFFDAEEEGLQGSKAFVENPPFNLNDIILNINLDMIARADKGEIYACGTYHYPQLKKYLEYSNDKIRLRLGHDLPSQGQDDWTNQSDHYSFHQKHIPFIYFGVEDHKDYHKASDDFDRVNKSTFTAVIEMLIHLVPEIDDKLSLQESFREKVIMDKR